MINDSRVKAIRQTFDDALADLSEQESKIGIREKQLQKERESWKEEKKSFEHTQLFLPRLKLDIGGIKYTTSLTTLCRFPDTMIGKMYSGRHALPLLEDGSHFIDRDGTYFRFILNFLRNPDDFQVPKLSPAHMKDLKQEAEYYGLLNKMFPPVKRKSLSYRLDFLVCTNDFLDVEEGEVLTSSDMNDVEGEVLTVEN